MQKVSDITKLRKLTTRKDKAFLLLLLIMTLLLSVIETLGVGLIMPFITFATNPSLLLNGGMGTKIYNFFNFSSTQNFMYAFSAGLICFYIFRSGYSILYNYVINLFAFKKYHSLSHSLFQKVLNLSYLDFTSKNADILRRTIYTDAMGASTYLRNFLMLLSDIATITILYSILLEINWKMTLVMTFILSIQVYFILKTISKKIAKKGEQRMGNDGRMLNILSGTFGNFKIIKIKNTQEELSRQFLSQGFDRAKIEVGAQTLSIMPRNILETIGFSSLVAAVAYILFKYQDANAVLPIISMYTLALYRVLPIVNRMIDSFNTMKGNSKALELVYDELTKEESIEGNDPIYFNHTINLYNICFSYLPHKPVIQDYSLTIKKGEKVAFVGPSGAGKSTLVDIITGFYTPNSGEIFIDETKLTQHNIKSWRSKIGYIPQNIYLFDGSVADNVAFGSEYDEKKIIQACKIARIYDFLQEHEGINTHVGDGGIKLSGGQKQRIGIARAIYDNPEILVLDEATSALDNQTEAQIMDEIYELSEDKTLLVIAHRLSTVERCDRRIEIGGFSSTAHQNDDGVDENLK